jgi:hypothetical protein
MFTQYSSQFTTPQNIQHRENDNYNVSYSPNQVIANQFEEPTNDNINQIEIAEAYGSEMSPHFSRAGTTNQDRRKIFETRIGVSGFDETPKSIHKSTTSINDPNHKLNIHQSFQHAKIDEKATLEEVEDQNDQNKRNSLIS